MILFNSDYNEGAHPKVLDKLIATNMVQTPGYSTDNYSEQAREFIKQKCQDDTLAVHFLVGGTQTNLTFIAAALRPHQGVIAANTGHISEHETGAIEATGHKVIELASNNGSYDGKLTAEQVEQYYLAHINDENHEHIVQPKLVYISNPTEFGTIYSKAELQALSVICQKHNLLLYMDGARLGYGLTALGNDLELPLIAKYCDAFYIGGTKVGALFGEALVIRNEKIKEDFRYIMKQRGALLAKGRLLGVQFSALFEDDLYFQISTHANKLAHKIKLALQALNIPFLVETPTNQQFPIIHNDKLAIISKQYGYSLWKKIDDNYSCVRFCTSWATREQDVDKFINDIKKIF